MRKILLLLLVSASAHAQVFKCTHDGVTTYSQRPCSDSAEVVDVPAAKARAADRWNTVTIKDEMTGERTCFAQSPGMAFFVGAELSIVNVRVGKAGGSQWVVIFTPDTEGEPSFHNEIDRLGIRVGTHPFAPVSARSDNLLVFSPETSASLIEQLSSEKSFRVRVRYWIAGCE